MSDLKGKSNQGLKKFARRLLATTCLTAAAAPAASAATILESSVPGADFGNTLALRNDLGTGVTEVIGMINPSGDLDFFQLDGLAGGSTYNITGTYTASARYGVLDTSGSTLTALSNNPASMTGIVPSSGMLVVTVQENEQIATYDLKINPAATVPEPASIIGAGLGLAAVALLHRRKK